MRKMLIAGALLLLNATPAVAQWGDTQWGMTPEEVIAVVPGAMPFESGFEPDSDCSSCIYQRVVAPLQDGELELEARFLFDSADRLDMVTIVAYPDQCSDYRKAVIARLRTRLGKGRSERTIQDALGRDQLNIQTIWTDRATGDRLNFSVMFNDETEDEYFYCDLTQIGPYKP